MLSQKIEQRLTKSDGQRIWKHFQRFCEYEDLKDLYTKVIPEIAKFEEKILGFQLAIDQSNTIIRQFDENLTQKCDKLALKQMRKYVDCTFAEKSANEEYLKKAQQSMKDQSAQMKDINAKFKDLTEKLQKDILREVRKSTAGLGTSYFEDKNAEGKKTLGS